MGNVDTTIGYDNITLGGEICVNKNVFYEDERQADIATHLDPAVAAAVTTTDAPAAAAPVQQLPIGPGGGVKVDPMALKVEVVLKGEGQFMERIAKSSEVRAAISNATRSRQRASYGDFR